MFFLHEIGEETMLGVEVVRYQHAVRVNVDNIYIFALVMIKVGSQYHVSKSLVPNNVQLFELK